MNKLLGAVAAIGIFVAIIIFLPAIAGFVGNMGISDLPGDNAWIQLLPFFAFIGIGIGAAIWVAMTIWKR